MPVVVFFFICEQYWRNPNYNFMRIELAILVAIVFSSSFIDAGEI